MPGSLRSSHDAPRSALTKTPELAVNAPAALRRPHQVLTSVPSRRTWTLKGWPSVRGGAASGVHVEAAPADRLRVTWMPPTGSPALPPLTTLAYIRSGSLGSSASQITVVPKSWTCCHVAPPSVDDRTRPLP